MKEQMVHAQLLPPQAGMLYTGGAQNQLFFLTMIEVKDDVKWIN